MSYHGRGMHYDPEDMLLIHLLDAAHSLDGFPSELYKPNVYGLAHLIDNYRREPKFQMDLSSLY